MSSNLPPRDEIVDISDVGPPPSTKKPSHKDQVRKWLAYGLLAILGFEIVGAFIAFFIGIDIGDIKSLLLEVIGPTAALVGSIVGFYFGSTNE